MNHPKHPSIIVTLGPSVEDETTLRTILSKNVSWVRLNMSHGSLEEHLSRYKKVQEVSRALNKKINYFIDLRGPKIRVKNVQPEGVLLRDGDIISITSDTTQAGNDVICIDIPSIEKHVTEGMFIFLHDGKIALEVISKKDAFVICAVTRGGLLESNKGVNIPDAVLPVEAITEKDKKDLDEILSVMEIDGVALSFVRNKDDIDKLKNTLRSHNKNPLIISKIETKQALHHIDAIVDASDIIMYARGDLGIEIPAVKIPITQKEICKKGMEKQTPVIVATQILSSMKDSPIPTRAEMSDAIDALIDGASHLMLSDETTIGNYPIEAVSVLDEAIQEFMTNQGAYKAFEIQ